MTRILSALLVFLVAAPAWAGAPATLVDPGGNYTGTVDNPLAAAAPPFTGAAPFTIGATVTPGRATAAVCTAAGSVTYALAGGASFTVPVGVGWNLYPFAVTGVSSVSGAACTYANLTAGSAVAPPVASSAPGGGSGNTADLSDPNNAYLVAGDL